MRYIDIAEGFKKPTTLFHYSKIELPIGTVLEPRGNFSVQKEIEDLFEKYRPATELPRNKVIYMMGNPDDYQYFGLRGEGWNGFLYIVQPNKPLQKRDASIIGLLQKVYRNYEYRQMSPNPMGCEYFCWENEEDVKAIIDHYWNQEPNPYYKKSRRLWEYTAPSAKITGTY